MEYKAYSCSSCEDHIDDDHHTGYSFDQEGRGVIVKGPPTEPDDFLPQRLNSYNIFETKDYDNGIQQTFGFFNAPNGKFIWQDYLHQDCLLDATQQYEPSLENLPEAVKPTEYYRYLDHFYYPKKIRVT